MQIQSFIFSDDLLDIVFKETVPGPMIINYKPIETSEIQCKFSVIAWRGPKSLRLYINKHDRIHFLHMLGGTLPEWLQVITRKYGDGIFSIYILKTEKY